MMIKKKMIFFAKWWVEEMVLGLFAVPCCHHDKSPICYEQDLNLRRVCAQVFLNEVHSSDNHYRTESVTDLCLLLWFVTS